MSRHWSEDIAKTYLEAQGYTTLSSNYTIRGAEIDLIMQDGSTYVFVEVRQRKRDDYGSAAESISAKKLQRIYKAALHYTVKHFNEMIYLCALMRCCYLV